MALLTCGEVFCGGGGWIANLLDVLAPLWAIDNDPAVGETYQRNFGDHAICADATSVDVRSLPKVDILFASPPCQQWSSARSKQALGRTDAEIGGNHLLLSRSAATTLCVCRERARLCQIALAATD